MGNDIIFGELCAINQTSFQVVFSENVEVTEENFEVEGLEIVAVTTEGSVVTVTTEEMDYSTEYNIIIKGLTEEDFEISFRSVGVEDLWELVIEAPKSIKSDGISTELVKFKLLKEGEVDEKANDVVLDLNATFGNLSQKRLTMQAGKGEVILRSEFNEGDVVSKIDAQVIEAVGKYKDLIGKIEAKSVHVAFTHDGKDVGEEALIKSLVSVNSNEADRVTLVFDEPILDSEIMTIVNGNPVLNNNIEISQADKTFTNNLSIKAAEVSTRNPKAVNVYLDVRNPDGTLNTNNILVDNKDVYVKAKIGQYGSEAPKSFKLTDARIANITGVKDINNKQIEVSFSEGISAVDLVIDGRHNDSKFDVKYGDVQWDRVAGKYIDNRNIVYIELNEDYQEPDKDEDGNYIYPAGYFKPGKHSIQASSIKDYAAQSDDKNIGQTQSLSFDIAEDKTELSITHEVHSPEQFLVKFNKDVTFTDENDDKLEFKNVISFVYKGSEGWEDVIAAIGNGDDYFKSEADVTVNDLGNLLEITELSNGEYLIELKYDWTKIYNTLETKDNYYNDEFAIVLPEGSVRNVANGLKNIEDIVLNLTEDTVLATPDVTSPEIEENGIVKSTGFNPATVGGFNVTMTEPVKLVDPDDTDESLNDEGATLAQNQTSLPETKVEFLGKDEDGKVRTFPGVVKGFVDELDMVIGVE